MNISAKWTWPLSVKHSTKTLKSSILRLVSAINNLQLLSDLERVLWMSSLCRLLLHPRRQNKVSKSSGSIFSTNRDKFSVTISSRVATRLASSRMKRVVFLHLANKWEKCNGLLPDTIECCSRCVNTFYLLSCRFGKNEICNKIYCFLRKCLSSINH